MKWFVPLLISALICQSALQLIVEEVQALKNCSFGGKNSCGQRLDSSLTSMMERQYYMQLQCFCDKDCHLFGECCADRAENNTISDSESKIPHNTSRNIPVDPPGTHNVRVKAQESTEVYGIPRDRWGCQRFMVSNVRLPVNVVRMVEKCPAEDTNEISRKCAALNRTRPEYHYTLDIPVLSMESGVWYKNVYCAICNGDASRLSEFSHTLECNGNYTKDETFQVLTEGDYSYEPLHWYWPRPKVPDVKSCELKLELKNDTFVGFLRPCGKTEMKRDWSIYIIEDCPSNWTDYDTARKCKDYALYVSKKVKDTILVVESSANDSSTVLSQVYKNPHCAICNGVSTEQITCWLYRDSDSRGIRPQSSPSLAIVMDFIDWDKEKEASKSCQPPEGVWDVLHSECIKIVYVDENITNSRRHGNKLNSSCPTIKLMQSEYHILDNDSLQYTGSNLEYYGHIFDEYELMEDNTTLICVLNNSEDENLISGASQAYLTAFCLSISVICLFLHIGTYYALPKLCNLPGKNLLSLSWALLFAQLLFLLGVNPVTKVPKEMCIGMAVVTYYCFLAAFVWMNVMSVDIWRTFTGSVLRNKPGMKTHRKYAVYAWGASMFVVLVALIVDLTTEDGAVKPSFGRRQVCWFGNRGGLGVFLVFPIFALLTVNTVLFAITVYRIWLAGRQGLGYIHARTRDELIQTSSRNSSLKASINTRHTVGGSTVRKDQVRFYLYLKLFTIMGLTWIFGFIAALANVPFLWYPFIIFNGLQGAFIFIMFDVKRKIAYMLWDKYVSRHGYEPPGFLLSSTSSSATKTTGSTKSKTRDSTLSTDKTFINANVATRTLSNVSNTKLRTTAA